MNFDKKQIEYRQKHPKCRWCRYCNYQVWSQWTSHCYWKCQLKDKTIRYDALIARFCKDYEVDKGDVELKDEI